MAIAEIGTGHISADELYTLAEIRARLGLGTAAMRAARRKGLAVRRIGRKSYVLGSDLVDYAKRCGRPLDAVTG